MAPRKSAEDRKLQIVEAVLALADRLGPDRITTEEVARAVGLTQPGIFRHFPTKQALWRAVAAEIARRLTAAWDEAEAEARAGGGGPCARLRALVVAQLGCIETFPALPSIMFSREMRQDNAELRGVFQGILMRYHARLSAALAQMRDGGELAPGLAVGDAAVFLTSLVQGLAIRWTLGNRSFSLTGEGGRLFDIQISMMMKGKTHD